ncbi:MAG: Gfo/Idh/MocA family oxidoreductase [Phycisphaerae bacterium]|nr:Gfo/Idh/MocA family oxidoreductase [Phycisphaerae bacterium]
MADEIRIGLVGMGGIMRGHVRDLAAIPEVKVVALMDPDAGHQANHKKEFPHLADAAEYDDYQAMLDGADLTGVVIASPHTLHFEQIAAALDRGVHVLVEKPLVCRMDHAREIVRKVRKTGLVLVIGYQRHYGGAYRYIRRAVAAGEIGRIEMVAGFQAQGWKVCTAGSWRQRPELSGGGQLNDSGSHLIDILLWMTGLQAETVSAQIDNCGTPVDINSALSIRFAGGAIGTLTILGDHPAPGMWEDITITGERGGFYLRQGQPLVQFAGCGEASLTVNADSLGGGSISRNFIRCIQGTEEPAAPVECGLRVIELTEAAWKSAAAGGKPVTVPRTEL